MNALRRILRILWHFAVVWVVDTISLIAAVQILPGITLTAVPGSTSFATAAAAALLLGIVNVLIRPLILLLAVPFGFFFLFFAGFIINAIVLLITSRVMPELGVQGLLSAIMGGLILAAVNTILTTILDVDDDSFFQGVVERLAKRQQFSGPVGDGQGLVILEVDGLSIHHLKKAIASGRMPTLKRLMKERGYEMSVIDCGLPSQTSACQAGIMFGDNFDIPSFRWYDKEKGKLYVSGSDAGELNSRYSKGQGLMRGGSSINNMMNGDAEKSLLTFANLRSGSPEEKRKRADDIYLLMLNPYFFFRTIVLLFADVVVELWQAFKQRAQNVQPRLNRLHKFYPFVRASTTVFMRDVSQYLITLDIIRGAPVIYNTYCGYDEVAHHSGPWSSDAMGVLRQFDKMVERILDVIERKAPRPYELLILSDHGQSFGATFHQRYGKELKEFIVEHMPAGTTVSGASGGDDGTLSMAAMVGELQNVQTQGKGGRVGHAVVKQTQKALDNAVSKQTEDQQSEIANLIVCGSGNIAQVYFDHIPPGESSPRKLGLSDLNRAYPGMVEALVAHEGVGFVVTYDDTGAPIALGKNGARNLVTEQVTGDDPLKPYGDPALRNWQVRRVADFPHSGDLIVNSTVYPDGTVAAMEELIGNHGGLGGEQTDAFLFHPADLQAEPTRNSADTFHLLNARRGLVKPLLREQRREEARVDSWAPRTLIRGLKKVGTWLGLAGRSIVLDRAAYKEVAFNPFMTGPAVLIGLIASILAASRFSFHPGAIAGRIAVWLALTLVVFATARVLRGRGNYTMNFRATGFAQSAHVLELLQFIPPLAPLAHTITIVATFFAMWFASAEANELRGWRSVLLPVLAVVLTVLGLALAGQLLMGLSITVETLATGFGLSR